ncbi:MAG TPA: Ig-like domain repeat protein [Casimicrobiaceae bacterium]|nr:Ig-like domain repeat protein [Casimicrobiaceae bacterium]
MTPTRTRQWRSLLCAALLASVISVPVLAHQDAHPAAAAGPSSALSDLVSGTVDDLTVENPAQGTTVRYPLLRQDDGTTVPLVGTQAAGLARGARVAITGRWDDGQFEVGVAETLAAPAAPAPASATAEGTLAIVHADDFAHGKSQFTYLIRADSGALTALELSALPSTLRGGMRVRASGRPGSRFGWLQPQIITVLSEAMGLFTPGSASPQGTVLASTTNTALVIMANFNDTAAPSFTQAQAQAVMTTNSNSVANYYSEVSYGQQLFNVTVTPTWVTMNLSSTSTAATTCDFNTIGSSADAAALAAGYNVNNYGFVIYLQPSLGSCGWAGLAYVGYHRAWINGPGSFATQIVAHEMGHNFGLLHAGSLGCGSAVIGGSCSAAEYGDPWDTMGNQRAMHFNAMQKQVIGFISAATVKTHSSGSASYTLTPIEQGSGATYAIKIPTSNTQRTYWVEFRQPIGFDAALSSYPNNGAQVRVSSPFEWSSGSDDTEIVDMTPGSGNGFLDSALVAGQTYSDGTYGISITVNSASASALSVSVTKSSGAATTTTLSSSANPSNFGASVTFTASVTGSAPTGTVNFTDGGSSISGCSSVALSGSGNTRTATCSTSALAAGSHSIVAAYGGDGSNAPSGSATLTQTVNKATSTVGLGTSLTPSTAGTSVTFTATVTGSAPTGSVNFKDGANSLSGCSAVSLTGSGNVRTATCASSALTVGTHSMTAAYSGDANNTSSTSGVLSEVISKMASSAALTSSTNPAMAGTSVTFTSSVTGFAPTGTVNFTDAGSSISGCSSVALSGSGNTRTATCSTSALTAGSHSIVAAYGGDASNNTSQSTALSEAINNPSSGPSTNVALTSVGAVASASSTFGSGSYPVSAIINGDRAGRRLGMGGVWKDGTQSVYPDWVEIDFNGSQTIDHVIVYSVQDNYLKPVDPSDTLTFTQRGMTAFSVQTWNGSAWVTQGTVTGNNLVKRSVAFPATSTSKIRVLLNASADGQYSYLTEVEAWTAGSSTPPPPPPTGSATTLSSSRNPAMANMSVTFTATVTGSNPTGSVSFKNGSTVIANCGAVALSGSGNTKTAVCTTSFSAKGSYSIVGSYSGNGSNPASASSPLTQTVNSLF